jgi:hypothetical protein
MFPLNSVLESGWQKDLREFVVPDLPLVKRLDSRGMHRYGPANRGRLSLGERRIFWMARNKRFTLSRAKWMVRHSPRRSLHDANASD